MDLDEALAQADVYAEETEVCTIDNDLRTITIPSGLQTIGVESDEDVRRLNFQMPKQYGEVDLSKFNICINFMNANNSGDVYAVTDKAVSGDNITFSWLVGRNALAYRGSIRFIVCLKKADAEGVVQQEFNTTVAQLTVLEGLETTEAVVAENPDIIEQILARLDELEEGGGGGGTTNYNNLSNQPQINGVTLSGNKTSADLNLQPAGTYLTEETDPTVPTWAKQATKPEYTADEVGALPANTEIPSKTSDLTNDSGFVTSSDVHNIPSGGTAGQVLSKKTNTNYDLEWKDIEDSGSIPRQEMQSADTTVTLQPNILYVFPEMSSLTVTLAEPDNSNVANEYHFFFTSGSTATTLTLNDVLSDAYSIEPNTKYEVSILENVAYIKGVAVNET